MPIAILEIPRNIARSDANISQAKELCDEAGKLLHHNLKVPDPEDKESRVVGGDSEEGILRMAFAVGENEYPKFVGRKSFFPTEGQINLTGRSILTLAKESQLGISQVIVETWRDTTFVLKEGTIPEPIPPVSENELKEIGSHLRSPRMKLFLSPQNQEGVSSKEGSPSLESQNYKEVTAKLSNKMSEMFGIKEVEIEAVFAEADIDYSVEFNCETQQGKLIPEKVRQYMAESVLHVLDSSQSTKKGSAEVWIRQGQPKKYVFK